MIYLYCMLGRNIFFLHKRIPDTVLPLLTIFTDILKHFLYLPLALPLRLRKPPRHERCPHSAAGGEGEVEDGGRLPPSPVLRPGPHPGDGEGARPVEGGSQGGGERAGGGRGELGV